MYLLHTALPISSLSLSYTILAMFPREKFKKLHIRLQRKRVTGRKSAELREMKWLNRGITHWLYMDYEICQQNHHTLPELGQPNYGQHRSLGHPIGERTGCALTVPSTPT